MPPDRNLRIMILSSQGFRRTRTTPGHNLMTGISAG